MSKLRSQLNYLTSDRYHTSPIETEPYNEHSSPPGSVGNSENAQKLADIKSTVENLTGKLDSNKNDLNWKAEKSTPVQTAQENLNGIDADKLAQNVARTVGNDLRRDLSIEIDKMRQELGSLQSNAGDANDQAVLNDIQLISQSIQDLQSFQEKNTETLGEMSGGLRGIQDDVRTYAENQSQDTNYQNINDTIQLAYNEIANKLDSLGSSPSSDQITTLSDKLETIKTSIASTDPETLLRIENQLHALGERIAALANDRLEGSDDTLDALLPEYFESFDRRLDEITRAVMASVSVEEKTSNTDAFNRIEARINSLAKSFDDISAESQLGTDRPQIPEQLQETLTKLEEHIVQVANTPNAGEAQFDSDFGNQISSLSQKIDQLNLESSDQPDQNHLSSDFGQKLDSLSLILERAINSGDGSVEQLEHQISQLSERIEEAVNSDQTQQEHNQQSSTQIAEQLQAISERVDSIGPGTENPDLHKEQLSALEEQMSAISTQLNSINGNSDMSAIEQRLDGIEEQFVNNREFTVEAATQAMQQIGHQNNNEDQASLISSLAEDLKILSKSSVEQKGHSQETFDAVRDSLSMILDRINSIETRMANDEKEPDFSHSQQPTTGELHNADMVIAAREYASSLTKHESQNDLAEGEFNPYPEKTSVEKMPDEAIELPVVDAPSLDKQHLSEMDNPIEPVQHGENNDIPLEPGSGTPPLAHNRPDMDVLLKQAKENKRKQTLEDEQQNPTDFIAAARRAAQAAANEVNSISEIIDRKPDVTDSSFTNLLVHRKKLVMLTAAAIILALLAAPAFHFVKTSMSNHNTQVKPVLAKKQPVKEQQKPTLVNQLDQSSGSTDTPKDTNSTILEQSQSRQIGADVKETKHVSDIKKPGEVVNATEDKLPKDPTTNMNINADNPAPKISGMLKGPIPPQKVGPFVLRMAAASGDSRALFEVGRRYTLGIDGPPDFAEAVKWYRLAAKNDHAPAQYRLGNFNEKGHGVTRDPDKAANWYELAAKQGNALAMHNLAVVHAMGALEGGVNMEKATLWFEKAAEFGVKDSQVNLGVIYATAMGVKADLAKAYKWFAVAARAGDKDAAQKRDTIAKRMKADQLKTTRGEVELWKPQELNRKVNFVEIPVEWKSAPQVTASLTSKQMISNAQSMLGKLGFKPGAPDGLMGAKTTKAIKEFQARAGIEVDGKVSPELLNALEKSS
ncbi:MAG: hypothetical protein GY761_01970 [Hyphomicrobiales bacterium]|nr:hypothetical protein [Hyphomicrobiales bacterium]